MGRIDHGNRAVRHIRDVDSLSRGIDIGAFGIVAGDDGSGCGFGGEVDHRQ
jgi:hypothetical protein